MLYVCEALRNWLAALLAAAGAISSLSWPVRAAEPVRAKVLIWVESAQDQALVERVRGQVSDLELTLVPVETKPVAVAGPGVVLVWFTRPDPDADVVVIHAARGAQSRVWQREIGGGGAPAPGGGLSSSTQEAAALVVREALRDMIRAEPPAPEPPVQPKSRTPAPVAAPVVAPQLPARSLASFRAELLWRVTLDGVSPFRRQGPEFRLGATYRALELSLFAGSSLPVAEHDQLGELRLLRQAVGVRGGHEWRLSHTLALDVGLRGGLVSYARSTVQLAPGVTPNADRVSVSALFGPELRLGWAPWFGPLELTLAGGVDVVPGAPRIGYQVDGRFEPSFTFWQLQPIVGIGAAFRSSRGH